MAVAMVLLGVATLVALEKMHVTDFIKTPTGSSVPTAAEKKEQNRTEQEDKKDFIETPDSVAQTPEEAAQSAGIDLAARKESNNTVTILTKLYKVSDGTCTLTLTNGSKTYSESAKVIYQPDFSTCAGFNVPKDKLGSGEWTIELSVVGNVSVTKTITFEVN